MMRVFTILNLICLPALLLLVANNPLGPNKLVTAQEDGATANLMEGFTTEQEDALSKGRESFEFQAEVSRLMDIIINSLYKNREVFLRELISNASDALDKLRFLAVSQSDLMNDTKDMDIKISFNKDANTLTIKDTGIGMTRDDLVNNLGTLAKSGTKKFMEQMQEGGDSNLIGQFGVGFYSVYLVADKVRVVTKNPTDEQYVWESTAESSFTIAKDPRGNTIGRGTEITMFLKEDSSEFLDQSRLTDIVKKHSEFITFPISLYTKTTETVPVEEEEKEPTVNEDGVEVEEEEEEEDKEPKTKQVDKWDWEVLNGNVAIWARDKDEITDEEYQKFYKVISGDHQDAKSWIHFKAEGEVEFKSILYIPEEAGDLYNDYSNRKPGIRLYVKKVLIQDDFEDLLPKYLNFVNGVADSDDLPLNVSRETLQQHKILKVMSKKLVRKVLEMLRKLSNNKSTDSEDDEESEEAKDKIERSDHPYIKFWEQFGKSVKMGVIEDIPNRSKLAKLLRFKSSKSEDGYISLDSYIEDKPEWQKDIYYVACDTMENCKKSPFAEVAIKKGADVLFLDDPIDEYVIQNLADYEGSKLQSLTKEGVKFGDEDEDMLKKRMKMYKDNFKPLTKLIKETLKDKVSKVTISQRLESTPSMIVTGAYGHSANMERIMRAQTFGNPDAMKMMVSQRTLEINPRHPIVTKLNILAQEETPTNEALDLVAALYDTALLNSGFMHDDIEGFSDRMYRMMASNLNLESLELEPELEVPPEPEEEEEDEENLDIEDDTNDEF